ncbi:MAG: peptidylprolyl isomerase [bacterium]|nr:peptidylprolyl isomerase [bacterium]
MTPVEQSKSVFPLAVRGLATLGLAALICVPELSAQEAGDSGSAKQAGEEMAKAAAAAEIQGKPARDDEVTRKDPVIKMLDKFIKGKVKKKGDSWRTSMPRPPKVEFASDRTYFWMLDTDCGKLQVELFPQEAPRHVESTIFLARAGFYDGLKFPRTIQGFMAQGGCPRNDTRGNAGYMLTHEFAKNRLHDGPGILSAANAGRPNTDGSQFFLTFVPTPHLNGRHTVYGKVVATAQCKATLAAMNARGTRPREAWTKIKQPPVIKNSWIVVEKRAKAGDDDQKAGADAKAKKGRGK